MLKRVAVLDDYQGAGIAQPYWKRLEGRVALEGFRDTLQSEGALVERLRPFEILVPIRERTIFTPSLLQKLPALELLSLTGKSSGQVDVAAATALGILLAQTDGSGPSAIEMTMALMLALAHRVAQEDRALRQGLWQTGIGFDLSGKVLGIVGLGRIGSRISRFRESAGHAGDCLERESHRGKGRRGWSDLCCIAGRPDAAERHGHAAFEAIGTNESHHHGAPYCVDETNGVPGEHRARRVDR